MVIAVRNCAFACVELEKLAASLNGGIDFRVAHSRFSCDHHRGGQAQADLVHGAVTTQDTVVFIGKAMPPGADSTLPGGDLVAEAVDGRSHRFIAGDEQVFGEKKIYPTSWPGVQIVLADFPLGRPVGFLFYQGQILFFPTGEQGESVQYAHNGMPPFAIGFANLLSNGCAAVLKDALRFSAVVGCRV